LRKLCEISEGMTIAASLLPGPQIAKDSASAGRRAQLGTAPLVFHVRLNQLAPFGFRFAKRLSDYAVDNGAIKKGDILFVFVDVETCQGTSKIAHTYDFEHRHIVRYDRLVRGERLSSAARLALKSGSAWFMQGPMYASAIG